jgi:hypothetical protein
MSLFEINIKITVLWDEAVQCGIYVGAKVSEEPVYQRKKGHIPEERNLELSTI